MLRKMKNASLQFREWFTFGVSTKLFPAFFSKALGSQAKANLQKLKKFPENFLVTEP